MDGGRGNGFLGMGKKGTKKRDGTGQGWQRHEMRGNDDDRQGTYLFLVAIVALARAAMDGGEDEALK